MGKRFDSMVDQKLDILAIGVHPDDVELGCGGTLIKHVDLGYKVGILDLTQGELGTRGNAQIRLQEAEAARNYASILIRENLGFADGFFENNKESKIRIVEIIRKYKPEIVLCNAIKDRHPDHGRAAKMCSEACFLSGLSKLRTKNNNKEQEKWRPRRVYHYIQDQYLEPDLVIDISDYLARKFEMINCFKSQFYNPDIEAEETPISSRQFIDHLRGRAIDHGRRIGVEYGEGFTSNNYIGADHFFNLV